MQLKSLLPAALAWSATAMLLPPSVAEGSIKAALEQSEDGSTVPVRVPCPGCAVALDKKEDGTREWDESGKNTELLFDLTWTKDNKVLYNKEQIYPPTGKKGSIFTVKQVKHDENEDFSVTKDDIPITLAVEMVSPGPVSADGIRFSDIKMQIIGLEDKITYAPSVQFQVFENVQAGTIVNVTPPQLAPTVVSQAEFQCKTVMCRVKAQIHAKFAMLKAAMSRVKTGCMKMMGMRPHHHGHHGAPGRHGNPPMPAHQHQQEGGEHNVVDRLKGGPAKFGGKKPCPGRKGMHGHHGHHRHGFIGRFAHGIAIFVHHILMPVLVGVAAGMAVSALGMVIGQLVFMVWMRLRARRNGGYVAVYQVVSEEEQDVEEEPLPRYEAGEHVLPPAYSDEKTEAGQ